MEASRRAFLGVAAGAASRSRILGANDRIRIAGIGTGGRCSYLLDLARQQPNTEIVAACDVYEPRRAAVIQKLAPAAQAYADYRRVLDRKDIDAVIIGSPDHWHVPMTVDAVRAGKDVYVEKPLTKTIEQAAEAEKAVAESGRVVQVGYQQRSWEHFKAAREVVAAGKLGKVTLVLSSWYQNYGGFDPSKAKVETDKLDWNQWLGSAPKQPLDPFRYYRWRWFWDFGGGHLTDLHSHYGDVIHWFMDSYRPVDAQASGGTHLLKYLECPETISCTWNYPGFTVVYNGTLVCTMEGGTITFRGTRAMMRITRDGFAVYPEGIVAPERTYLPEPETTMKSVRDGTVDHIANWLACIRDRKQPNAPVSLCAAAATAAHLGNKAYRTGERVKG